MKMKSVTFKMVYGRAIPMRPWPQVFYVSRKFLEYDAIEVRPLTLTGLIRGIGKNFIAMNYWRFMYVLRGFGFLSTKEYERLSWSHFTIKFWKHMIWFKKRKEMTS